MDLLPLPPPHFGPILGGVWESCSGPPGGPDADFLVWFPQWVPHHRIFPDPFFFISRPSCPKGAPFPVFSRPLLYILAGLVFQIGLPTDFSRPMFFYKQAFLSQGGPLPVFSQTPFVYISRPGFPNRFAHRFFQTHVFL